MSLNGGQPNLHAVWPSPGLVHYINIFGGPCPLTEFCQVQTSLCVEVLSSPILAALLHGTRAMDVSQTLRRSAEGPPIFDRAAITLSTGPHSSFVLLYISFDWRIRVFVVGCFFHTKPRDWLREHVASDIAYFVLNRTQKVVR